MNDDFIVSGKPSDTDRMKDDDFIIGSELNSNVSTELLSEIKSVDIQDIYDKLKLGNPPITDSKEIEISLTANPAFFDVIETTPFSEVSAKDKEKFELLKVKYLKKAEEKFGHTDKLTAVRNCLNKLNNLMFNSSKVREDFYEKIKSKIWDNIKDEINKKLSDGVLELTEIVEVIEYAKEKLYVPFVKSQEELVKEIKNLAKNVKQVGVKESFLSVIEKLPPIDKLDSKRCKDKLFENYKSFVNIYHSIFQNENSLSDDEMKNNMIDILSESGILRNHIEFYKKDFLINERKKNEKLNFKKLFAGYYYYLMQTALQRYDFTEEEWFKFQKEEGICKEDEEKNYFILGKYKADSVYDLPVILRSNPIIAEQRIIEGDLETFLELKKEDRILSKIRDFKSKNSIEQENYVEQVITILNDEKPVSYIEKSVSKPFEEFLKACSSENDLFFYLSQNICDESIFDNLTNDSDVTTDIRKFFQNGSYESFLMKLVTRLLNDSSYKKYKYNIKKVLTYIQKKLESNPPAYFFVYIPFISAIYNRDKDLISKDERKQIEDQFSENDVKQFLEKEQENKSNIDNSNKKSGFFSKKRR